jgi:hypothetical protein
MDKETVVDLVRHVEESIMGEFERTKDMPMLETKKRK